MSGPGSWPDALRPRVTVWLDGSRPERALKRALDRGVRVESARSLGQSRFELVLAPEMLGPLRRAVRGSGRVRVRGRRGGPYLARSLAARPGLWIGAAAFVAALGALSSMVWSVRAVGVPHRLGTRILAVAAREGVRPGKWRGAIDRDRVAAALARALPSLSWAGVSEDGGLIVIRAVPRLKPLAAETGGRLLVASHSGTVVAVHVRQGQADVRVGERVQPGQVLAQGYLVDGGTLADGSPAPPRYVAPHVVVMARWSASAAATARRDVRLPTVRRSALAWMLVVHGRTLWERALPLGRPERRQVLVAWRIRLWGIEWMALRVERVVAAQERVRRLSRAAAKAIALRRAERRLERTLGTDVRIVRRKAEVVITRERAAVTIAAEVEGDVARPQGALPAQGT